MQAQSHNEKNQVTQDQVEPPCGKQVYGVNYFETFTPVVTWFAINLMIISSIVFC
jgi:hypothetical protein